MLATVTSIKHTTTAEKQFNKYFNREYHEQYIGQTGKIIDFPTARTAFEDFMCVSFDEKHVEWFHKLDITTRQN